MTSDVIYQSSKPSSMLSFHCCSESSHLLNFLARLLLHPHSLFVLQYGNNNKKNIQNINYTVSIWQTYVGMKHSTDIFELFMFQATDNKLEALEQSIRMIILFKYYHVLILISCNQKLIRGFLLEPIDLVNSDNGRWFHQQKSLNRKRQKSWMLTYLQPWEETNQTYQVNQQPANWDLYKKLSNLFEAKNGKASQYYVNIKK